MRRVWVLLAGVGLAATTAGCHHLAGVCDCEAPCNPCWVGKAAPAPIINGVPVVPAEIGSGPEPIRSMPRTTDK